MPPKVDVDEDLLEAERAELEEAELNALSPEEEARLIARGDLPPVSTTEAQYPPQARPINTPATKPFVPAAPLAGDPLVLGTVVLRLDADQLDLIAERAAAIATAAITKKLLGA